MTLAEKASVHGSYLIELHECRRGSRHKLLEHSRGGELPKQACRNANALCRHESSETGSSTSLQHTQPPPLIYIRHWRTGIFLPFDCIREEYTPVGPFRYQLTPNPLIHFSTVLNHTYSGGFVTWLAWVLQNPSYTSFDLPGMLSNHFARCVDDIQSFCLKSRPS